MKRLLFYLTFILILTPPSSAQPAGNQANKDESRALKKSLLLFDLQALESKAARLDTPLAKALAKAEIADAVWTIDRERAAKLLREAYELTLPGEEEQARLREKPAGSAPTVFSGIDRARGEIRNRVMEVARRDKDLSRQLSQLGLERLGKFEGHYSSAIAARKAYEEGDKDAAAQYLLESIQADPTQITAASVINEIAAQDRALADRLIIQYIERLRSFPLSHENQSDFRTFYLLAEMVRYFRYAERPTQPPGSAVMKAYVSFMLESLNKLEQGSPGYLLRARPRLLSVWASVQQYAPELTGEFMDLERRSRGPGDNSPLPTSASLEERSKERYEKRVKEAAEGGKADEAIISTAIAKGDYAKARAMIDKLADGPGKQRLGEVANEKESLSLATRDDMPGAVALAGRLNSAASVLNVYQVLISKCVAVKDQSCAMTLIYQAVKQLKHADTTPGAPPAGIPASALASEREFDPVLSGLGKFAMAITPLNETLALEILDEVVAAANGSRVDTSQGRTGFDASVFKKLAPKNEGRVRQAAESFKDPLRQIVALATVYQWKADELAGEEKAGR